MLSAASLLKYRPHLSRKTSQLRSLTSRRAYSEEAPKNEQDLQKAIENLREKFDLNESVPNQFLPYDASKNRRLGQLESALWMLTSKSPRNIVCTIRTKDHVFSKRTLDVALGAIQRRHPFLHSGMMTLPILGPYFVMGNVPLEIEEAPIRSPYEGFTAEKTFDLQVQQVVEDELNRTFVTSQIEAARHEAAAKLAIEEAETRAKEAAEKSRQELNNEVVSETAETAETAEMASANAQLEAQKDNTFKQLPLLRARLIQGQAGCGQALVFSMPQLISDAMSMTNVVKEVLEYTQLVEKAEANGQQYSDPKYLLIMQNLESMYPAKIGGISAFVPGFKYWMNFFSYVMSLKPQYFEKWNAWLPEESRTVKFVEKTIDAKVVKDLKALSKKEELTLGHTITAATVAATHEVFFPDNDEATMPVQVWVDLRRRFTPQISNIHLGLLVGCIQGLIKSSVGDSIWQIAKQARTLDAQLPEGSFRSTSTFRHSVGVDSYIMSSQRPTDQLQQPPFFIAPVTLSNIGELPLSSEIIEKFHIDSASVVIGQALNTKHTTVATLPNGKMSITVSYPDTVYKKTDVLAFTEALSQHLKLTSEGE